MFEPWDPQEQEPCDCKIFDERNQFQGALDEIAAIIDGKRLDDLTDLDLDEIRKWVSVR